MPLTANQRERAEVLRAEKPPWSWHKIAQTVGATYTNVRYAMDEEYRNARKCYSKAQTAKGMYRDRASVSQRQNQVRASHDDSRHPLYDPKRDGRPRYVSASAELLGDPPEGRRALLDAFRATQRSPGVERDYSPGPVFVREVAAEELVA